jgi:hypothetical protein
VAAQLENLKPSSLQLTWQIKNIRKHYEPKGPKAEKFLSRFYIYFYLKAPEGFVVTQKSKRRYYKKSKPYSRNSLQTQDKRYQFSPSLSSRVRMYKNESMKTNSTKKGYISVEINVIEPLSVELPVL